MEHPEEDLDHQLTEQLVRFGFLPAPGATGPSKTLSTLSKQTRLLAAESSVPAAKTTSILSSRVWVVPPCREWACTTGFGLPDAGDAPPRQVYPQQSDITTFWFCWHCGCSYMTVPFMIIRRVMQCTDIVPDHFSQPVDVLSIYGRWCSPECCFGWLDERWDETLYADAMATMYTLGYLEPGNFLDRADFAPPCYKLKTMGGPVEPPAARPPPRIPPRDTKFKVHSTFVSASKAAWTLTDPRVRWCAHQHGSERSQGTDTCCPHCRTWFSKKDGVTARLDNADWLSWCSRSCRRGFMVERSRCNRLDYDTEISIQNDLEPCGDPRAFAYPAPPAHCMAALGGPVFPAWRWPTCKQCARAPRPVPQYEAFSIPIRVHTGESVPERILCAFVSGHDNLSALLGSSTTAAAAAEDAAYTMIDTSVMFEDNGGEFNNLRVRDPATVVQPKIVQSAHRGLLEEYSEKRNAGIPDSMIFLPVRTAKPVTNTRAAYGQTHQKATSDLELERAEAVPLAEAGLANGLFTSPHDGTTPNGYYPLPPLDDSLDDIVEWENMRQMYAHRRKDRETTGIRALPPLPALLTPTTESTTESTTAPVPGSVMEAVCTQMDTA